MTSEANAQPVRLTALPPPPAHLRQILTMYPHVLMVLHQPIAQELLQVSGHSAYPRDPIDHVAGQMEAVQVVPHRHVEWRRCGPFLLVAAHMEPLRHGAAIDQSMDQPRVAVEREDHRLRSE